MKKVLFMLINMNIGGTEKALLNMIEEMPKEQYDITILMLEEKGGFLNHIPNHIHVKYLKNYKEIKRLISDPPQNIALNYIKEGNFKKAIDISISHIICKFKKERSYFFKFILNNYLYLEEEYDVAVAYAGPMDFITYFIANKVNAKKKIQWIHFDVSKIDFNKVFTKKMYDKFNKILVVSKEGKNKLIELIPNIEGKTEVFTNIISPKLIEEQSKEYIGFNDNFKGIRLLTVGRLSLEKGQDLAIKVLKMLKKDGYKVRWYCVGDGRDRELYRDMIIKYDLDEDFILLGAKTNPYPYMKDCDIYIQPSRHEGYCITLAESKCFNKPIITTNFVGAYEQIVNEKTGLIVNCNEEELYKAIKRLIVNKNLIKIINNNLKIESVNNEKYINKIEKLVIN